MSLPSGGHHHDVLEMMESPCGPAAARGASPDGAPRAQRYGVTHIDVAGHPEGSPHMSTAQAPPGAPVHPCSLHFLDRRWILVPLP